MFASYLALENVRNGINQSLKINISSVVKLTQMMARKREKHSYFLHFLLCALGNSLIHVGSSLGFDFRIICTLQNSQVHL